MEPLVRIDGLVKRFHRDAVPALDGLSTTVAPGRVTGLVGPDGAGKTTLMRLMAGLLLPDAGALTVCGLDPVRQADEVHRVVSYMPQRFGLYEDLSVIENLRLYADLRSVVGAERVRAFERLLAFTGLAGFTGRLAGKLSGGMKQKLGLACALLGRPRLLLLDEPSVGVDPISRRELWRMVYGLVEQGIGVVWSTAYLDEAERCAAVILLNEGHLLFQGVPQALTGRVAGRSFVIRDAGADRRQVLAAALRRPDVIDGVIQGRSVRVVLAEAAAAPTPADLGAGPTATVMAAPPRFEDAFVDMLGGGPKAVSQLAAVGVAPPNAGEASGETVVAARDLTKRFGGFTAADRITFSIRTGEIFGLIGPNGAGKSTTFKMMCGLLRPTSGTAEVAGLDLYAAPSQARARIGYMAQKFSLYGDLSLRQNLAFFAGVYGLNSRRRREAIARAVAAFGLEPYLDADAGGLPLGFKQRLALACAVMHDPAVLFLDEPTSGVDPLTRREFWSHINAMVERGVTVMVTTHFLDEAEYCDRIGLIYRGSLIAQGSPEDLKDQARREQKPDPTLEEAFITLIESYDEAEAA